MNGRAQCQQQQQSSNHASNSAEVRLKNAFYLLTLFELQLDPGLDAIARVLVGLLQSELHEVLVVRPRQAPTDENDHVGQDLRRQKEPLSRASVPKLRTQR